MHLKMVVFKRHIWFGCTELRKNVIHISELLFKKMMQFFTWYNFGAAHKEIRSNCSTIENKKYRTDVKSLPSSKVVFFTLSRKSSFIKSVVAIDSSSLTEKKISLIFKLSKYLTNTVYQLTNGKFEKNNNSIRKIT